MTWSKLKYLLPTVALFVSPWFHKMAFMNFQAALHWDEYVAHLAVVVMTIIAAMVTLKLLEEYL